MRSKTASAVSTLSLLLLGACAQTETNPVQPQENKPAVQTAARYDPPKAAAPAPVAPAAEQRQAVGQTPPFAEHTVIEFDTKSRVLGDDARESIALLRESMQIAKQIVITGYCDKRTVSNAKEVALLRAMAVKKELLNFGASEKNIRVKYATSQAKHEVTIDMSER